MSSLVVLTASIFEISSGKTENSGENAIPATAFGAVMILIEVTCVVAWRSATVVGLDQRS